jgi:hypothetical protein
MPNLNELREAVEIVKVIIATRIECEGCIMPQSKAMQELVALATEVIEATEPSIKTDDAWKCEFQYLLDRKILSRDEMAYLFGQIRTIVEQEKQDMLSTIRLYQTKKRAGLEEVLPDMLAKAQIKVDDTHYDVDIKILAQAIREEMR